MKQCFNRLSSAALAAACAVLSLLAATPVRAGGSQVLSGHVPRLAAGLHPLRHMDGTNRLQLAISLPLRDKEGLTNLFNQIYDPRSTNFHHYLTASQFAERFGPTVSDYQTLKAFLISNNLGVTGNHPNRAVLDVAASVADIERVFHIEMEVYQHPSQNRTFYAPSTDPTINLSVPLLHITGLDNAVLPFPKIVHKPAPRAGEATPRGTGSGPLGNFQGYDFRDAYVPNVSLTGAGQSVSLFELDGYYASDVTEYEGQTGLPNVPLMNVLVDGFSGVPQTSDGDGECTLDIDMAIAMAPGISAVYVYEGLIPLDILNKIATDNISRQISCSWGWEPFDPATDQIFQQLGVQGQSFLSASGDDGAEPQAQDIVPPSDDPYITEVGGTTLTTTGPLGLWVSETVWSWFSNPTLPPDASSGGSSYTYPIPVWQQGINMSQNGGSTSFRNYPDVALTADNIYIIANQGFPQPDTGGTSCAAPLWAGFMALVNQQASANDEAPLGFINPAIYALAKSSLYDSVFHDITTGNDTNYISANEYFAQPGYDLCTGWGTPFGGDLINALAPISTTPVFGIVTNSISGGNGNGVIDFDECNNLTIILTNEGGVTATGVSATLSSSTLGAIVAQSTAAYPVLLPHNSSANLSPFTLSTEPTFLCGTPINLTLVVKSDQVTQTNHLTLSSGVVGSPDVFTSSTPMPIPNTNFVPINSPIMVSGLQAVGSLTVSVYLTAFYDAGLTLQLISPSGSNVLLSANNGGFFANYGTGCGPGMETTFADAATESIVNAIPPYVGSFQPQQPLSVFHLASGANLNGTWNLQVLDEFPGDTAALGCWSLNISPEVCIDGGGECPGADLSLTMSARPNPVFVTNTLVYTMTVSNAGPGSAENVVIVQSLPPGVGYMTTSNYPVTASFSGSNLDLALGTLPVYGSATVSVITIPTLPGIATSVATVGSQQSDPNPGNNSASATVLVSEPTADVSVSMAGSPSVVLEGGLVTYTINVTNNGPFTANNVILANTLPANANFVSATTSQGTIIDNGTYASLGNLPEGTNVTVTIVISPTVTGNITATTLASISSLEVDPITFNNFASVSTTVGPAADLGVFGSNTPSPVIAGSNVTSILTVYNAGPNTATGVQFTQTFPTGSTFVSSSLSGDPGYTAANNVISAAVAASLTNGQSILVTNVFKSPTLLSGVKSQLMSSTVSVFGQPGDPNTNNNVLTLQTLAEPPTETVVLAGITVTSGSANGSVGPTGTYGVQILLQNTGTIPTANLVATLQNGAGLTVLGNSAQTYGSLMPDGPAKAGQYSFETSSTNGGKIYAVLQLQDGSSNLGTITNIFVMPVVQTFSNTNFISIPTKQYIPQPDDGPGSIYPSPIVVSGVSGSFATVTVTVSNLIHTYPNDIGMLLIGPTGSSCVLMSAAAQYTTMPSSATVTFDQNAPSPLAENEQIVSGSYQPADYYAEQYGNTETYTNAPAHAGAYNSNLSVFSTLAPNGTWSLYVYDFAPGDAGAISNGWSLAFTTITPVNQVADLGVTVVASTNQVILGNNITNFFTVTNTGPDTVVAVLTNILPAGLSIVTNMLPSGAASSQNGVTNLYTLGSLAPGSSVVVTNVVLAIADGAQTTAISVGSYAVDPNTANNRTNVVTTVNPPPVDLIVPPISVTPNPVVLGSNLVYMLSIANNGPSNAFNVVGTLTFPTNLHFVSAVSFPAGGACVFVNHSVQCTLGTLADGSNVEVTVQATAQSPGVVTNVWSVTTTSANVNSNNSSVTTNVTIIYPMAVITNGPVTLISQAPAPLNGAINANQTNTVSFTLVNIGPGATTNLVATLLSTTGIRPVTLSNTYGAIPSGGSVPKSFTFVGSGSAGATITAELTLKDGNNTSLGPIFYTFMIPISQSYNNSSQIIIPFEGPATPYPSEIEVSGLNNGQTNLLVSKVTATLNGFAHSWPHDVEAVLVSPTGQEVALMEHSGSYFNVTNLVLTFDDNATQALLLSNSLSSGTFLATEYSPFDTFPGLGPVPTSSPKLATFNGMNPNGIWSLYVYDDTPGNDGVITGGWSLALTAVSTVSPAALLQISTIETPSPATAGDYANFIVTVNNFGPATATGVILTNIIPVGTVLAPAPAFVWDGTYSAATRMLTTNLGTISNGASALVTVKVIAGVGGIITNTAIVTSTNTADLNPTGTTNLTSVQVIGTEASIGAVAASDGTLQLTVNGYSGQSYIIQTSTNLVAWIPVYTNTGFFTYTDTTLNAPRRFYRTVQVAQ